MKKGGTMNGIRLLIVGCLTVMLYGCGSAFAVKNDTSKRVYIDTVYPNRPRNPSPQALEPGITYSTPGCWREIAKVFIGPEPDIVIEKPISKLCKPNSCSCVVNVSQF